MGLCAQFVPTNKGRDRTSNPSLPRRNSKRAKKTGIRIFRNHGVVHFRLHGKCHHDNAVRRRSQARALMACLHRQVRTAIVGQDPLFALLPCERSFVLTGLISLRCSGKTPRILEQKNQLPLVRGRRLEAETTIERLSICVDGVCQQSPNPRVLSNGNRSANSVLQQAETKTLPLVVEIDSQPRQNDQRNRVLAHPATNPLRSVERVDLANGQAEVPGNATSITGDERFRRTATLSLACVSQQPIGEGRFSAVKLFQPMIRIQ